jgi:type IV pilus assembly protein PilW
VKNIEAHVLMAGQQPIRSLTDNETNYVYSIDGDKTPTSPTASTRGVQPKDQGFGSQMLRREFSVLVSVRNYNP